MTFRLRCLSYRYRRPRPDHRADALANVSVDIPPGVTAVLGRNGSGKSTLLGLLGLLTPWRAAPGEVVYREGGRERDYAALSARGREDLRRRSFGFVLQSSYLLPHLSCLENVAVPLALAGLGAAARTRAAEALFDQADPHGDLRRLRHERPRDVSGGERQRVAILRAVVHDPTVIFADEPFSSLDPFSADRILALLRRWADGELGDGRPEPRTLVLVSHTLATAVEFARGRCALLRNGRLLFGRLTTPDDLVGGADKVKELIS